MSVVLSDKECSVRFGFLCQTSKTYITVIGFFYEIFYLCKKINYSCLYYYFFAFLFDIKKFSIPVFNLLYLCSLLKECLRTWQSCFIICFSLKNALKYFFIFKNSFLISSHQNYSNIYKKLILRNRNFFF
jgi:hypothetical protein